MTSRSVHGFTAAPLDWSPYVTPVSLPYATTEQLEALKVTPSGTAISDYVLVLAHDPQSLTHRSPLYNAVMYDKGGLGRADRELGALAASIVNHCVYCASVHADRYMTLSKRPELVEEVFARETAASLPEREQAIFDFATKLSRTPPAAGPRDVDRLRKLGFSTREILDLVLSVAMFAWANRLMHTLGEPVERT